MRRCMFLLLLCLTFAFVACEDAPEGDSDVEDTASTDDTRPTNPYLPDSGTEDDASDVDDTKEPIFVGKPCERDADCTTGRCYGKATAQGAFEQPTCQDGCVVQQDFSLYCNSDIDCCNGTCCIDCGFRKGLCVAN